jgi:hypothetical protein
MRAMIYSWFTFMMTTPRSLKFLFAATLLLPGLVSALKSGNDVQGAFQGSTDIGQTKPGSTVYDTASESYLVTGGGADMWGGADAFHMSWIRMAGDGSVAADIHFPAGDLPKLEKAVLIFRQSLDPGSPYADIAIHGDGHITLQYRTVQGGETEDTVAPAHGSTRLRIERKGNGFTAYTGSTDDDMSGFSSTQVEMKGPVYVGIGVCAHDADGLAGVTFSNVVMGKPPVKVVHK